VEDQIKQPDPIDIIKADRRKAADQIAWRRAQFEEAIRSYPPMEKVAPEIVELQKKIRSPGKICVCRVQLQF
jgi:hypothetical protein